MDAAFADHWGDLITGPVLWMNGTDHQMPQPWLGRVVAEATDIQADLDLRIVSLAAHLAATPTEGLPPRRSGPVAPATGRPDGAAAAAPGGARVRGVGAAGRRPPDSARATRRGSGGCAAPAGGRPRRRPPLRASPRV